MELIPRSGDIDDFVNAVGRDIGELPKLITSEKGNLVDAINEIALRHANLIKIYDNEIIKNQNTGLDTKIWIGTQTEYDSIDTKDSETLYMVK